METQNKELKNLTPQMVEKLRTLGVEFGDTQDVWQQIILSSGEISEWKRVPKTDRQPYLCSVKYLPAPNLQEVINKLPKSICVDDVVYHLMFFPSAGGVWCIKYTNSNCVVGILYAVSENLLQASFQLLKELSTDYPNTLKQDFSLGSFELLTDK